MKWWIIRWSWCHRFFCLLFRYYIIDPRNSISIGGEMYLIDYLLLPSWRENSGGGINRAPLWNQIYVRINQTDSHVLPPYCTSRQLEENGDIFYYHPCVPFELMKSSCSKYLSWGDVRIRGQSGVVWDEETISLLRIKSDLTLIRPIRVCLSTASSRVPRQWTGSIG